MADGELRHDLMQDQLSSEGRLLVGRVRVGLWILLCGTIWFGLIEFLLHPGEFPPVQIVRVVHISIVLAGFWLLPQRATPRWATMVALFVAVSTCFILAIVGIVTHVTMPPLLLFVAYVLGAAALLPWGAVPEAILASAASLSYLVNFYFVTGGFAALQVRDLTALAVICVGSVYISYDRHRTAAVVERLQRQRREEAVRDSEERYRSLVETAHEGVLLLDVEARTTYVNRRMAEMVGCETGEMIGRPLSDFLTDMRPFVSGDGAAPSSQTVERRDILLRRRDGSDLWAQVSTSPIRDGDERVRGTLCVLTDITQRKLAEDVARQQQAELAHVLRLNTVGEMAATFAHEINQPLAAIANYASGCARRLRSGEGDAEQLAGAAEEIALQARRAGEIVRRVRDFIRKDAPRQRHVAIDELVRDAVKLVEADARLGNIDMDLNLCCGSRMVEVDPVQIQQVVINLVRNGLESVGAAGRDGGRLSVRTALAEDDGVEVAITDTGLGVSPGDLDRLFEPFFTTKPNGLGMGLGISRSVVEAHGGRLWCVPNEQLGMTFHFRLPALPANDSPAAGYAA